MDVKTYVFNTLTGDATLAALTATRVYNVWAPPESTFPYITYRTRQTTQAPWAIMNTSLAIDIFDYNTNESRLNDIESRIIHLLDRAVAALPDGAIARLYYQFGMDVAEEDRYIWHRSLEWNVRHTRNADIEAITGG